MNGKAAASLAGQAASAPLLPVPLAMRQQLDGKSSDPAGQHARDVAHVMTHRASPAAPG
jgi:hypothetical protein